MSHIRLILEGFVKHRNVVFVYLFVFFVLTTLVFAGQRVGIYDYDVLESNPDLIQKEPGRVERSEIQKNDVKGIYDFDSGSSSYAGSRVESEKSTADTNKNSRSKSSSVKTNVPSQDDQDSKPASQSFSDVSEQLRTTTEKRKKSASQARAFQAEESRLFDFDDEPSPEMPDLTTVVTDNVKPSVSYE